MALFLSCRSIVASGIDLRSIVRLSSLLFPALSHLTLHSFHSFVDHLQLSPFTDLDSAESELAPKWRASKAALVLLMRSWVGLVQLSSDDMAWPTLIRMLRDPKVNTACSGLAVVCRCPHFPLFSRHRPRACSLSHRSHSHTTNSNDVY